MHHAPIRRARRNRSTCAPFRTWPRPWRPAGLSDHSMGIAVPVAAVALGASIVEKHSRWPAATAGPTAPSRWSRTSLGRWWRRSALPSGPWDGCASTKSPRRKPADVAYRRSLFVVQDVPAPGEPFTAENVRSIRPGIGLPPKHLAEVLGRRASRAIGAGTPLSWGAGRPKRHVRRLCFSITRRRWRRCCAKA